MKKTHIPQLDEILSGGIPGGSSILFCAVPGVECEAFGYQIFNGMIDDGDKGFIFTNVAEPHNIILNSTGMDGTLKSILKKKRHFS